MLQKLFPRKLESRSPNVSDLRKNFNKRINLIILGLIIILLSDEFIKEGYLFYWGDVFVPGTHEFIISFLILFRIFLYVITFLFDKCHNKKHERTYSAEDSEV